MTQQSGWTVSTWVACAALAGCLEIEIPLADSNGALIPSAGDAGSLDATLPPTGACDYDPSTATPPCDDAGDWGSGGCTEDGECWFDDGFAADGGSDGGSRGPDGGGCGCDCGPTEPCGQVDPSPCDAGFVPDGGYDYYDGGIYEAGIGTPDAGCDAGFHDAGYDYYDGGIYEAGIGTPDAGCGCVD